jgi:predicted glycoside hydrolase/deacetylase ChbG (UPF0249 family)
MSVKRLIVNADDFGRTAGINRGIVEGHRQGVVTSASLMVNYPAALEVPALAKDNPELGVGLHLALTGGVPALPLQQVRTLVDGQGRLPAKPEGLAMADPREILAEARAQLRRFREIMGRMPTHFDAHHHAHRQAMVLDAVITLAWETGLPVRSVSDAMRARFHDEGIPTPDHFAESFYDQKATLEELTRILSGLELGTTELMCHPAVVDDELKGTSSYAEPRARELIVLMHRDAKQALQAAGIRLIHFGAL